MATSLDILIRARDEASSTIKGVGSEAQRLDSTVSSAGTKTSKLGGLFKSTASKVAGIAAGAFAVKKAFDFGADLVHSAEEARAATQKSLHLIASDADHASLSFKDLTDFGSTFGERIGQDDEAIVTLSSKLASAVNLTKLFGKGGAQDGLEMMTKTIIDMSAATGKSQSTLTKMFNTMANDPAAALGPMLKAGVITQKQADHFKKLADAGHSAEVSQKLLTLANDKYAGTARKTATPTQKLGAMWDNLKETLGNFLLPLFDKLMDFLMKLVGGFQDLLNGTGPWKNMLDQVWKILKPLVPVIGILVGAFLLYTGAMKVASMATAAYNAILAMNPIILVIAAVILLVVVIVKNWAKIKAVTLAVWNGIKGFFVKWFGFLKGGFLTIWGAVKKIWGAITGFFKAIFSAVAAVVRGYFNIYKTIILAVYHTIISVWNGIKSFFSGVFGAVKDSVKVIWDTIKGVILGVWDGIKRVWNGAIGFFGGIWDGIIQMFKDAWNTIAGLWNEHIGNLSIHVPGTNITFDVPDLPTLKFGGIVDKTGLAVVHEGEMFSGVRGGAAFGRNVSVDVTVRPDRRRYVSEAEFDYKFGGV